MSITEIVSTPEIATRGEPLASRGNAASGYEIAPPVVKVLGHVGYDACYAAMRALTASRTPETADELWVTEHEPVYTVGIAGRAEHFPRGSTIPVVRADRGGQITYHGPGQTIVYCLIDLARRRITVSAMVSLMEQAVIDLLARHGTQSERRKGAPGIYVGGSKIAALGLRVRSGRCYHGVALNVSNDLAPFDAIDPCGYPGLRVTRTESLGIATGHREFGERLAHGIASEICAASAVRTPG